MTAAKVEFPELKTVNAQVLQQVLRKLEAAFLDMGRKGMGFPRFKNRYRMRSFVYPQLGKSQFLRGNQIKLPQLGWLEYIKSREIPDGFAVKQARIVRNRGLSGVGRILNNKEIACGDGLAGTGNRLVKSPRSRKKSGEACLLTAS